MIYTSYWSNVNRLQRYGIEPVAVSRGKPKWFRGRKLDCLAPTWEMLHMGDEEYNRLYAQILARNDPNQIARFLGTGDVALLCWEKDPMECHRRFIAQWLRDAGYECEEWNAQEARERERSGYTLSLF